MGDAEIRHNRQWDSTRHMLGLQVTLMRVRRGWTQEDLAERAQAPVLQIQHIEAGDLAKASLKTLKSIAGVFDVGLLISFAAFSTWLVPSWFDETGVTEQESK